MKKAYRAGAALLAVGALALAGCAGDTEPTYDEPVDLTMTLWTADEAIIATFQELADEFREENPELGELTIQTIPFAEYNAQLGIRISSGDAPDLGWIVESATPAWVDSGALYDISALKDDPEWNFDDVVPGLLAAVEGDGGELWAFPFTGTTHPIIYNVDAFREAGIPTPNELLAQGEWDWNALKESAKALVDAGVVDYGFDIPQWGYASYALMTPILKGQGAVAYPGGDTCGLTDPKTVAAFEYVHEMIYTDGSYPAPGTVTSFPTGDTGMYLGAPSTLGLLAEAEFEYDMAPQPQPVDGSAYNPFLGQASMAVFADGETPELATRLLGYFTSQHGAESLPYYVSPRAAMHTQEFISSIYPQVPAESSYNSLIDTLQYAEQIDYPIAFPEIETAVKPSLDAAWVENADIPAALQGACDAATPILG